MEPYSISSSKVCRPMVFCLLIIDDNCNLWTRDYLHNDYHSYRFQTAVLSVRNSNNDNKSISTSVSRLYTVSVVSGNNG